MPIRFRCVYCNKLLGIARRKAGMVVNCPSCGEKLIVPNPDEPAQDKPTEVGQIPWHQRSSESAMAPAAPHVGVPLFERNDFESLLQPEPTYRSGEDDLPPRPLAIPATRQEKASRSESDSSQRSSWNSRDLPPLEPLSLDGADVERLDSATGVFIARTTITILSVAAVLLIGIAFGAGLLVGRMMK